MSNGQYWIRGQYWIGGQYYLEVVEHRVGQLGLLGPGVAGSGQVVGHLTRLDL